jgi:formylmethanofuran dehydrogenase subunit E
VVLPRILTGQELRRKDLARLGEGGFCMNCKTCSFPKCPFGK